MRKLILRLLISLTIVFTSLSPFFLHNGLAAERPRIAIADLDAIGVNETLARTASEILRTELFKTGYFSIHYCPVKKIEVGGYPLFSL
ncbi:MAG: hypothetical protein AB1610_02860 [Nitrospirota bacterium]